mmetsp:Transcript_14903/g.17347  ORF Transcript_14903/g.17347 Transcript_14903/m.17347 type:complete len:234 (+) Transcript_14903:93-794(+)
MFCNNRQSLIPSRSALNNLVIKSNKALKPKLTPKTRSVHFLLSSVSSNKSNKNQNNNNNNNEYLKSYKLSGIGQQSFVNIKTNTNHSLQTDVPKSMGGRDKAPQPVETLLASWMGCTQATSIFVGRNMEPRLYVDKIEFHVEAYRDERGALGGEFPIQIGSKLPDIPARLERIIGEVRVYAKIDRRGDYEILQEDQLLLLGNHTEARCPVANMMKLSGCQMDVKWVNGIIDDV